MFYVAYNKTEHGAGETADHVSLQRRTRLFNRLAAHGRFWA